MDLLKITAVQPFSHGRLNLETGDSRNIEASEACDLEKAGLVVTSPAGDEDMDDLVGDTRKKAPLTSNKMEPKPDNKGTKK